MYTQERIIPLTDSLPLDLLEDQGGRDPHRTGHTEGEWGYHASHSSTDRYVSLHRWGDRLQRSRDIAMLWMWYAPLVNQLIADASLWCRSWCSPHGSPLLPH